MDIRVEVIHRDGWDVMVYHGPINEESEVYLADIADKVGKKCVVNFRNVNFINSCGVRGWINFMRVLEKDDREIVFEECPSHVVMQINMIPSFKGGAQIRSVFGSYVCENCDKTVDHLFDENNFPQDLDQSIDPITCAICEEEMEMDELEEEFFAFLAS